MMEVEPAAATWKRLERELGLSRYRTPWHRRVGVWRAFAAAVTAVLVAVIGLQFMKPVATEAPGVTIAQLEGKQKPKGRKVLPRKGK